MCTVANLRRNDSNVVYVGSARFIKTWYRFCVNTVCTSSILFPLESVD